MSGDGPIRHSHGGQPGPSRDHRGAIWSDVMNPVEITLLTACALLLLVAAGAVVSLRRLVARSAGLEQTVDRLRETVEELARREAARETAEAAETQGADWVITFDGEHPHFGQQTASTQRVVSSTLGEPLIKVAAFSHGVRRALREEKRAHLAYQVRREYRRRRKASRTRARARA